MEKYTMQAIGVFRSDERGMRIELDKAYAPALCGLEGFGHIQMLWWFSRCDTPAARQTLQEPSPYKQAPPVLGTFATRSPLRPNPIALSCPEITYIDEQAAVIGIAYADADDGTPVLDIKPYTPSLDRVETPRTPAWCAHWPGSVETSGAFDWDAEFTFE